MIKRILTVCTNASMVAACIVLLLMMAHVTADVVLKWAIHRPVPATLEFVTYYYMAGVVFLPLPAVQLLRQQIMVEVFTHSVPKRVILAIDSVVGLVCAVLLGVIAYYAYLAAVKATSIGDFVPLAAWSLEIWPGRWFVVTGLGVTAALFLLQSFEDARSLLHPER